MSQNCFLFLSMFVLMVTLSSVVSIRVTCIGDSITSGGACQATPNSYVEVLQEMLGSEYEVLNAGNSGHTMLKKGQCNCDTPSGGCGDCSYWSTDTWPMAMASQPDIVTIMLGTNDGKFFNWEGVQQDQGDYYALDYVDMINQLRTLEPQPEIFVMIPPPLYEPYPFKMNKTIINDIYPTLIRDIASVMRVQVIDVHSRFVEYNQLQPLTNLTCDGCHPTVEGVVIIADVVRDAILSSYKTIQADANESDKENKLKRVV